jgi:hypothetical protein
MSPFQNPCLPGLLLATLFTAGCAQSSTAPTTNASTAPGTTAAKPGSSLPVGFYQMTFLNSARQEVTTLPVGAGSQVLVKVHVEDSNHLPAGDGSALYEVCRWKGVSPTTGTRGGAAPSARCADGLARWERWNDIAINPVTGNAYAGIDFVNVPCVMGWRVTYRGSRTIAPAVMGPADITWQ